MRVLEKISLILNRILVAIGGIFLVAMCLLTCSNIVFRLTWVPVRGTYELMGFFGAVVTAFALGHTQKRRGHISVDVLVHSFSPKVRKRLQMINDIVCMIFFSLAAWQVALKAGNLYATGEVTETLRIIYYPFTYAVALGCFVLVLVFLLDFLKALLPEKEGSS
jgi:TRAP-type C4-dicarboxylate transport system permease small subunit